MRAVAEVRAGRAAHATAVAALSTFAPITLVAWVSWQLLEGEGDTLLRSQFGQWAGVTLGAAVLACVAAAAFWSSRPARLAAALGVVAAALAVAGGLLVDVVGSGGLA